MDSAEPAPLADVLRHQGVALGRHEAALNELAQRLTVLAQRVPNPPTLAGEVVARDTPLPPPERYSGEAGRCRGFLLQCSLAFELQPSRYPSERSKVAYLISLLTGRALEWATALWEQSAPECLSESSFKEALKETFCHPAGGREAGPRLLELTQGSRSVADYVIEFRTLAAECGWGEEALIAIFHRGLAGRLKDELATRDPPATIRAFYTMATSLDTRLRQRARERGPYPPFARSLAAHSPPTPHSEPEPMQLGMTRPNDPAAPGPRSGPRPPLN